jgi:hypothetical protein
MPHCCYRQRQDFRASSGKEKVWGAEPDYIVAKYTTKDGETRSSLLLCSGWWSLSRCALLWAHDSRHSLPCLFLPSVLYEILSLAR